MRRLLALALVTAPAGPGAAQGISALTHFSGIGAPAPGGATRAGLTLSGGVLYGATQTGGANNLGTVFRVNTNGTGFQTLVTFNGTNGDTPLGSLTAAGGVLYGTAYGGGANNLGTVFRLNTDGTNFQTLVTFGGAGAARRPNAGVVESGGVLYGTALQGGAGGSGTTYRLNTDGSNYQTTVNFSGGNGAFPRSGLTAAGGVLYGTTQVGGANNSGTVFRMNPDGSNFQTLQSFAGTDGSSPINTVQVVGGVMYGTTFTGGTNDTGTVFRMNTDGSGFQTLVHFGDGGSSPSSPSGLVLAGDGFLYGTTQYGGAFGLGAVYRVRPDGTEFSVVDSFRDATGYRPYGDLILSPDGFTLYGTTSAGGVYSNGSIFAYPVPEPGAVVAVAAVALAAARWRRVGV